MGVSAGWMLGLWLAATPPAGTDEVRIALQVEPASEARMQMVLGAHLRMGGLRATFVRVDERADLRVVQANGTCRVSRIEDGEPRGFWSQPCTDEVAAVELENLAHAARSLALTAALPEPEPEPGPESELGSGAESELRPERGPEPEPVDPVVLASDLDEVDDRTQRAPRFTSAPHRQVFTAQAGWTGWAAGPGQWQNGATARVAWTTAHGVDVGVGAAMSGQQAVITRTLNGDFITRSRRWPVFADAGYRVQAGRRVDIGLSARGGIDIFNVRTEHEARAGGRGVLVANHGVSRTVTGFVGPAVSVGVWTSGPVVVRARTGLELPIGRQPVADTDVRIMTGVDLQFGVGPGNLRKDRDGEETLAIVESP